MRTTSRWAVSVGVAVAALAAGLSGATTARGQGAAMGELGAGGSAKGDISRQAGEEDRIGIDLVQGSTLDAQLSAAFASQIELLAPNDAATPATFSAGATRLLSAWSVPETGKYHFRIRSADGSQGAYALTAKASWTTKLTLSGQSGGSLQLGLPAGASVKGTVTCAPGSAWDPSIASFLAPNGVNLLAAPVAGSKGVARLPKTSIAASGLHAISVTGGAAGGQFQAALSVKPPKVKPTKIDISNGITGVSFAQDGIAKMMADHGCVGCHTWAADAAQAKLHAVAALPRIKSGQMPVGGARLSAAEVALFQSWIKTGMAP